MIEIAEEIYKRTGLGIEDVSSHGMDGQKTVKKQKKGCSTSTCETGEETLKRILQTQSKRLEDKINEIKKTGAGRMAKVFKLKEKIVGKRKGGQEPIALKDPKIRV